MRRIGLLGLPFVAAACLSGAAIAGPISSEFALTGDFGAPGMYDLTSLQALPATTQIVGTETYTGTNLWTLLNAAGGIRPIPGVKNSTLRNYVVAVGSDGYQAVFSGGKINPKFGNQPDIVAYGNTGGQLGPGGPEGFARMVAPNDVAHGRYVSNLVTLHVGQAPSLPGTGGGISNQFTLTGDVSNPGTYTLSSLEALPSTTLKATYLSSAGSVTDTYTGVSLWTLITAAGLITDPSTKNDVLANMLLPSAATGTKRSSRSVKSTRCSATSPTSWPTQTWMASWAPAVPTGSPASSYPAIPPAGVTSPTSSDSPCSTPACPNLAASHCSSPPPSPWLWSGRGAAHAPEQTGRKSTMDTIALDPGCTTPQVSSDAQR